MNEKKISEFNALLASKAPAPGGGGASALAASLGAADAVGGMLPLGELDSLEKRFGRKELL